MDTADRFVNCQCVKYLLRINEIDRAIDIAGLFTRVSGSVPLSNGTITPILICMASGLDIFLYVRCDAASVTLRLTHMYETNY